jgi:subtilase family serine protease
MKTLALTPGVQPCTGLQFIPGYGPPPVAVPLPDSGGPCAGRPYTTNDLRVVYDDQNSPLGSNTNVAVFTEGNISGIVTDLQLNERDNGLRQVPVNIVPVDFQSQDVYGQGEWTMDTQASTGIAGDVKSLTLYNAGSLDDNDISMTINRWVTDDVAQDANASFGECEYQAYLDASMAIDDAELQEGALQGQTLFSSSGDSGSSCGYNVVTNGLGPAGPPQVAYPAASPYVMGAGGTSLLSQYDGSYFGEISWYSGGGGISLFEAPEFWTYSVVPTQCLPVYCSIGGPGLPVAVTSGLGRAVPDVAMDADVDVGPVIYYEYGAITENGGTSLASPLSMGTFTRLQSRHNNRLGFAAPNLYASYIAAGGGFATAAVPTPPAITTNVGGMHDIAYGANGIYTAMPGYDFTTGMGSFDISNLIISFGS